MPPLVERPPSARHVEINPPAFAGATTASITGLVHFDGNTAAVAAPPRSTEMRLIASRRLSCLSKIFLLQPVGSNLLRNFGETTINLPKLLWAKLLWATNTGQSWEQGPSRKHGHTSRCFATGRPPDQYPPPAIRHFSHRSGSKSKATLGKLLYPPKNSYGSVSPPTTSSFE